MSARLSADDLARFRADYHECGVTIMPLVEEVEAAWADAARLQTIVNGLADRVARQSELLSRRAEKAAEGEGRDDGDETTAGAD